MSHTKKCREDTERKMTEEMAQKESEASSVMKLAMDTLDRGLEVIRSTHRSARKLRSSVEEIDVQASFGRLAVSKK